MKKSILAFTSLLVLGGSPLIAADPKADADNSKKNERDRSSETKTPQDQSNDPADVKLAAAIRRAVVKDDGLTMTAKNVKIITAGGQVTLRGPVQTAEEKKKIEHHAQAAAGKGKVTSQIEVKAAH